MKAKLLYLKISRFAQPVFHFIKNKLLFNYWFNSLFSVEEDGQGMLIQSGIDVEVKYTGAVRYFLPFTANTLCPINVKYFPFDRQKCELIVRFVFLYKIYVVWLWDEIVIIALVFQLFTCVFCQLLNSGASYFVRIPKPFAIC